jgi:uncharacterized repeat protein (TIGR03803 family)
MHRRGQLPTSLFRTISLVALAPLVIAAAAIPALAQNSVPPTAVQAAKMPQYASRLAHPSKRVLPPKSQVFARATKHRGPLQAGDIYDNGPINGNTDAWTINFGFIVSDSFNVTYNNSSITGMSFGAWLFPGDTVTSVEVSITSGENGGTSYFDQTVNFTQSDCVLNQSQYGSFNVCLETSSAFTGPTLNAGTYWVNLQNASVPSGDPVYWDENSGVGCTGQGCPSSASENTVGTIPSESFTILGNNTTSTTSTSNYYVFTCPDPQPGFHDLRDFSSTGPSGLAIDTAGKLYGTFANGGSYGAGVIYDFAQRAGHWFLSSLYSFLGASNGSGPNGVIVGPGGTLYGAADGGLLNCSYHGGQTYCGLIYETTPGATPCASALCSWNETTIYQFTGPTDAAFGSVTAFDSAGNLYGVSGGGGANGQGAVFELSPSQGGWTEKILYSFTGGSDGGSPNSLLLGQDGNLYGTAAGGGNNGCGEGGGTCGVVFQLVPSGAGWRENVIYAFTGSYWDGWDPSGLIQDSQGNLLGVDVCYAQWVGGNCSSYENWVAGVIFGLRRSGGGWEFGQIHTWQESECPSDGPWTINGGVTYNALTFDPAGNLWAAGGGSYVGECGDNCYVHIGCGEILNVETGMPVISGFIDIFGNIASDANGNLYGTTSTCGFGTQQRNTGMIWQYSP